MGRGKARKSLDLIDQAIAILQEIQPCTVRAVCYRLFTAGAIPSMKKPETNKVSRHLTYAREHGLVPWEWIVDETREPERVNAWADPAGYIETVKRAYRKDRWTDQAMRVEIWSEKGTVRGTLAPVLHDYGVTFRVMHGYGSSTALHQAAVDSIESEKPLIVLYVGDWDPSGLHMSNVDLPRRVLQYGGRAEIIRLALTAADIADPALPWFLAETKAGSKEQKGDPRYNWYVGVNLVDHIGKSDLGQRVRDLRCWELDALSPNILRQRVEQAIRQHLDLAAWHQSDVAEQAERESLLDVLSRWPTSISRQASEYRGQP